MWETVAVMALTVVFEPIRIGLAALMLSRPRPPLQLLTFLCGGLTIGIGLGAAAIFLLHTAEFVFGTVPTPLVQITTGITVLVVAALLAAAPVPATNVATREDSGLSLRLDAMPTWLRRRLVGTSLFPAYLIGGSTALPSANFAGAMAVIATSGEPVISQVHAMLMFNVVAFALVEIPLIAWAIAPGRTRQWTTASNRWLQERPRRDAAALVALGGCIVLAIGIANL